jgi:hypothetical protein
MASLAGAALDTGSSSANAGDSSGAKQTTAINATSFPGKTFINTPLESSHVLAVAIKF